MMYIQLFFRMLRYRVAIMLLLFFLIGATSHNTLQFFSLRTLLIIIALCSSYVAATTINDLADLKIDKINHPKNTDRPLAAGKATRLQIIIVYLCANVLALIPAYLLGINFLAVIIGSLTMNFIYSMPPLRISHRPFFAPICLTLAYVLLPFVLGILFAGSHFEVEDMLVVGSLMCLFFGRIILKDFRDRRGDRVNGKKTMLSLLGKNYILVISFISILMGKFLLLLSLPLQSMFIYLCFLLLFLTVYICGYYLFYATTHDAEQFSIGIAAKMGNGILVLYLSIRIFTIHHASYNHIILFVILLTIIYIYTFFLLLMKPGYLSTTIRK